MEDILGLCLGGIVLLTPIIFILTKHQQKMATILQQNNQALPPVPQVNSNGNLEISALKELVHQQSIAIDNLAASHQELRAEMRAGREMASRVQLVE